MSADEITAVREALAARPLESVRVTPPERDTRTPLRRRRAAAMRAPALPGLSLRELAGRDPLAGFAGQLALKVTGRSASIVGVPRRVARDLALDAGLPTMLCPVRREQVIRADDCDRFVESVLARGLTVVVRPEGTAA